MYYCHGIMGFGIDDSPDDVLMTSYACTAL